MIKAYVKTKPEGRRFLIPVPNVFFHVALRILTSKSIVSIANRSIRHSQGEDSFQIPPISYKEFKPLLAQLNELKGLRLVDINLEDGTEISIKL